MSLYSIEYFIFLIIRTLNKLIGSKVNIITHDDLEINGVIYCYHKPTEILVIRLQDPSHTNKCTVNLIKTCFIKKLDIIEQGNGVIRSNIPKIDLNQVKKREKANSSLRKMSIYIKENNIDVKSLQVLSCLNVLYIIFIFNSPNCEFNNGIISVDNKLFIHPPYKVDNIDGDVKNYSHIINIVLYNI